MFKQFRWRIALWFVGLSMLVYLSIGLFGVISFHASLTHALDQELQVLSSEMGHAIDLHESKPTFREWTRLVETEPARGLATIQLYDANGDLLERYGPRGIPSLLNGRSEVRSPDGDLTVRVRNTQLTRNGKLIGYLQIELPTRYRDTSTRQLILTVLLGAPLVMLGMGICSYFVSGKAVEPIHENVRMLQRFVADAGHELNTPLSIVQARADSLERKLSKQGDPPDDIDVIRRAIQRMAQIVSDLMLLAEMESPLAVTTRVPMQLDHVVSPLVESYNTRFLEKGISFQRGPVPAARILVFPDAIQRVLGNLLENALRYTDPTGKVSLQVTTDGRDVCMTVEDSGAGIPPECVPRLFDRFYRVDKSRSRVSGGVGLGLSIVKAMVEAHKGRVWVESQLGKGSKFQVVLPVIDNHFQESPATSP